MANPNLTDPDNPDPRDYDPDLMDEYTAMVAHETDLTIRDAPETRP